MVNIKEYNKQEKINKETLKKIQEIKNSTRNPLAYKDKIAKEIETTEVYTIVEATEIGHSDTPIHMSYKKTSDYDINMSFKRKLPLDKFDEQVANSLESILGKEFPFMQSRVNKQYKNDDAEYFNYVMIFKNDRKKEGFDMVGTVLKNTYLAEIPVIDQKYKAIDIHVSPEKLIRTEFRDKETIKSRTDYNYLIFTVKFKNENYAQHKKEKTIKKLQKKKKVLEDQLSALEK